MKRPTVVVPDDYPPVLGPSAAFKTLMAGANVTHHDSLPASTQVLLERIADAEAVLNIRSSIAFGEEVFAACPMLRVLSLWGTGTDHVDLSAAKEHGVIVTNTPGVSAVAMAEHALALMLAVARDIPRIDAKTRKGAWPRGFVTQLHGKTLGVVGLGAIGLQTARVAKGIGMRVIAWTRTPGEKPVAELGIELVDLDDLYRQSDVVSLHVRLTNETTGMVGRRQLAAMKPTAILVNTARGAVVDEAALLEALRNETIRGAGLDVFEQEPMPENHPLAELPNVVITPHSGGVTAEALETGLRLAVDNVFAAFRGKPMNLVA
ncbi:MAG: hydroxyacid dehydrogenase [Bryobacterales bacterium]|nr:hydroxyacid dehydrogenase [Bryobacterales bacterium]MDE0621462.1 hydroxyacid dehydrogenase [Bryobacterales bacterium]